MSEKRRLERICEWRQAMRTRRHKMRVPGDALLSIADTPLRPSIRSASLIRTRQCQPSPAKSRRTRAGQTSRFHLQRGHWFYLKRGAGLSTTRSLYAPGKREQAFWDDMPASLRRPGPEWRFQPFADRVFSAE